MLNKKLREDIIKDKISFYERYEYDDIEYLYEAENIKEYAEFILGKEVFIKTTKEKGIVTFFYYNNFVADVIVESGNMYALPVTELIYLRPVYNDKELYRQYKEIVDFRYKYGVTHKSKKDIYWCGSCGEPFPLNDIVNDEINCECSRSNRFLKASICTFDDWNAVTYENVLEYIKDNPDKDYIVSEGGHIRKCLIGRLI